MPHSYLSASTVHLPSSSPFMTPSASTSTTIAMGTAPANLQCWVVDVYVQLVDLCNQCI